MSTPVAETKPAEEQVPKEEAKEETSATTTSEEVQMKEPEKEEATVEPSTAAEPSTTTEPSTTAEPTTAMEVDSSQTETKPAATASGEETKPEVKAKAATTGDAKAKNDNKLRLNGAARKRFRWLLDQGYSREEAVKLAKEPLKTKELRDRFNADTGTEDVDEELKNLSGAAKKRFKWLLKNGYTEKEALKMAREPMNAIASKRNLSTSDGPPTKVSKPTPETAGGVVMVVAARDYPTTSLTQKQTNEIKSAILKEVVQQKDSELKPRFESCVHVKGYLRVHCSDQETRKWLQRVVDKLTIPEGIKLKVASEKNLLKGDIYTGYFTDSRGDTNEAILEFVESQNDGIDTSKWKILTRKEVQNKQTIELMFTVDPASSKSIHNLGYELNYKFNKIKVRKQIKPTEKAPVAAVANVPNVRTARSMAPPQRRPFNQQPRPTSAGGSFVPIWDSNMAQQKRVGNNFNQFDNPRNSFSSGGSGTGNWNNGLNSFGLGAGGSGSFGMNNGNNSFGSSNSGGGNSGRSMGSNRRSDSFGGSNRRSDSFGGGSNRRSDSFGGGSNSRSNSNNNSFGGMGGGGRGGNQSNSNRPFDLVDSLYDQLKLIGSGGGNSGNNNSNNGFGSSRRSGGSNNGGGSNQWGRNTSNNSSFSGRSSSGYGNRSFFTTTRSGFF